MFYTIYKITNLIDGKIYIGKHQTQDLNDGYMGSGKLISYAKDKHGIENFKKEILFQFDNEADMNSKEAELVTDEFCLREDNYNLCPGGQGGWGYINNSSELVKARVESRRSNAEWLESAKANGAKNLTKKSSRDKSVRTLKERYPEGTKGFAGMKHSVETIEKLKQPKNLGSTNPQYGTMWITNGKENKKIKKVDVIPEGWYKGRISRFSASGNTLGCGPGMLGS